MVDNLVDRTSKRCITLLSFGPKADGTLAEPIKTVSGASVDT